MQVPKNALSTVSGKHVNVTERLARGLKLNGKK